MSIPRNDNDPREKQDVEKEKLDQEEKSSKEDGNKGTTVVPPETDTSETPRKHDGPLIQRNPSTI